MKNSKDGSSQRAAGDFAVRGAASIGAFTESEWASLAGTSREDFENGYNPFLSFSFLSALEESGCAIGRTGWQGHHLVLTSDCGSVAGCAPAYLKSHSQGEYIFDHSWADAYTQAGGRYYPKLQVSVPFTPVTGPRLLHRRNSIDQDVLKAALASGLKAVTDRLGVSSAHVTFAQPPDMAALANAGFLRRTDQQFHFFNENYGSYEDFLSTLASRKRKAASPSTG